jgi:hypothetical protein
MKIMPVPQNELTPSDLRIECGYRTTKELSSALYGIMPICAAQIGRYERGEIDNIDHSTITYRMCAIAEKLNIPVTVYRAAVRRQMEKRSAK